MSVNVSVRISERMDTGEENTSKWITKTNDDRDKKHLVRPSQEHVELEGNHSIHEQHKYEDEMSSLVTFDLETIDDPRSKYPVEKKIEVIGLFTMGYKVSEISKKLGIPSQAITGWKNSKWWYETEVAIRNSRNKELTGVLSRTLDKALVEIEDRIEYGNRVLDREKNGEYTEHREPLKARDLAHIINILHDKKDKSEVRDEERSSGSATSTDFKSLKKQFEEFAKQVREEDKEMRVVSDE